MLAFMPESPLLPIAAKPPQHTHAPCPRRHAATPQYLHDVPLARGAETSAEYSIPFPRQLPPREFVLQMTLFYSVAGQMRSRMFFNETVNVIEEPTLLDIQLLGLYLFGAALLAAACEPPRVARGGGRRRTSAAGGVPETA